MKLLEQAQFLEINPVTSSGFSATRKLLESWVPTYFLLCGNQATKITGECAPY